jgi:hypothetical protein
MRGLATLALALTLPACESTTEPISAETAEEIAVEQIAASAGLFEEAAARGGPGPALFDRLASEIPGFAGFYFAGCDLVVVLTDRTQAASATTILTPVLRRYLARVGRRCQDGAIRVQPGDYTWTELSRYLPALRPLTQIRGVGRIGISIPQNRIVVQVRTRALVEEVKAQAETLGVPPGAIAAVVMSGRG